MDAHILLLGTATPEASTALNDLAEALTQSDISNEVNKTSPRPGMKDGGLTIAIAIAGLTVSAIATLVSVLSHWRATRPHFTLTITRGPVTVTIENPTPEQLQAATSRLRQIEDQEAAVTVQIEQQ